MNQYPFFVYGTLLPGQPNYVLWEGAISDLQPAALSGVALFDLDWYPMLVDWPGDRVEGLLVRIRPEQYAPVLARLDFLEGFDPMNPKESDYRREKRLISLSGGEAVVAWVYVGGKQLVAGRPRLQTNWIAHLSHGRRSVNDWWQAVRTVGREGR
jgi:gamma-glutamylcyclotransferase (GGCT)/AIG2-like uncharacterized protein YtfP